MLMKYFVLLPCTASASTWTFILAKVSLFKLDSWPLVSQALHAINNLEDIVATA